MDFSKDYRAIKNQRIEVSYPMPNSPIKVRMSILERRQIAILSRDLNEKLELDQSNARIIQLSINEAKRVLDAIKSDTRKHRAMTQSALERAMVSISNAIVNAMGSR